MTTAVGWVATAGTDDALMAPLVRRARRPVTVPDLEVPGVLFVQLDGLPFLVPQWGVVAGTLPTLSRWFRSGAYRMQEWTPMLPATTQASQMGTVHGTIEGIPAFRWSTDRPDVCSSRIVPRTPLTSAGELDAARATLLT
jgi:hypothetical protein